MSTRFFLYVERDQILVLFFPDTCILLLLPFEAMFEVSRASNSFQSEGTIFHTIIAFISIALNFPCALQCSYSPIEFAWIFQASVSNLLCLSPSGWRNVFQQL